MAPKKKFVTDQLLVIFVTERLHKTKVSMRRDVFQAIADPNRRAIINLLAGQKLSLNGVAGNFDISRPAISKHIKILTECGLIVIRRQGRERFCEARLRPLNDVSEWVEQYRIFWTGKLDALEGFLNNGQQKKSVKSKNQGHKKKGNTKLKL